MHDAMPRMSEANLNAMFNSYPNYGARQATAWQKHNHCPCPRSNSDIHHWLITINSQEYPRQQVQQQGNEGETLRLKEITFLPHRYFQKLNFYHICIFRAVEVGKAEGAEMFEGGDEHRAAEKVREKFAPSQVPRPTCWRGPCLVCTQLKYGDGRYLQS